VTSNPISFAARSIADEFHLKPADVRLFLLGSAIGALMHQRGLLVLHGSTVKVGDECVVFLGSSGVGKSTLATQLRHRGYACLGDDVCAISIGEDGVPYAAPAYPPASLSPSVPPIPLRSSSHSAQSPVVNPWSRSRAPAGCTALQKTTPLSRSISRRKIANC